MADPLKERLGSSVHGAEAAPQSGPPHVRFAARLFEEMVRTNPRKNLVISPVGVEYLLGMVSLGAEGRARKELAGVLGVDENTSGELVGRHRFLSHTSRTPVQVELAVGNSAWVHNRGAIAEEYVGKVKEKYDADVRKVDFGSAVTVEQINTWVGEATRGRIQGIVESLDPAMRLMLINAIYFLGKWAQWFEKSRTEEREFTRADRTKKKHASMSGDISRPYVRGPGFEAVSLPYAEFGFHMDVFLPDGDVASFLRRQDDSSWMLRVWSMQSRKGYLELPRFSFQHCAGLVPALQALGVKAIFDPRETGLSKIGAGIHVNDMRQKALIRVDEEGTEAVAVSHGYFLGIEEEPPEPPPPFCMIVNRPFCFTICHYDCILFAGVVEDPEENWA